MWKKIARWMEKFKAVEDVGMGSMKVVHVKAHTVVGLREINVQTNWRGWDRS